MLLHPGGDRSVDEPHRKADQEGERRRGADDSQERLAQAVRQGRRERPRAVLTWRCSFSIWFRDSLQPSTPINRLRNCLGVRRVITSCAFRGSQVTAIARFS
jgi:hypothetical protein